MKRTISMLTALFLVFVITLFLPSSGAAVYTKQEIIPGIFQIFLRSGSENMDVDGTQTTVKPPTRVEGDVLVPLRSISEALNAIVQWNGENQTVSLTKDDMTAEIKIGSTELQLNGNTVKLSQPAKIIEDTTMVDLALFSQAFGMDTFFDGEDVVISKRTTGIKPEINREALSDAMQLITTKTANLAARVGAEYPSDTEDGIYKTSPSPGWTGGFFVGLNYISYDHSQDEKFIENAAISSERIGRITASDPDAFDHDIGFILLPSYLEDYLRTGNEDSKTLLISGADALLARVNEPGYIQAWDRWGRDAFSRENLYRMIVDTMCNIPLLFEATKITDDPKYSNAAVTHARLTQKYLVRNDFSSCHTFVFTPTGSPDRQVQFQGATDESCWARGQAWIINGMALAYKYTGNESFLKSAKHSADTFLRYTDHDLIPRWDLVFQDNPNEPKDTSAGAIMACGLMDIWEATGDEFYKDCAYAIWANLYEVYSTKDDPDHEGIIKEGVGNKPGNSGITCSLIYGDYYFALLTDKLLKL